MQNAGLKNFFLEKFRDKVNISSTRNLLDRNVQWKIATFCSIYFFKTHNDNADRRLHRAHRVRTQRIADRRLYSKQTMTHRLWMR